MKNKFLAQVGDQSGSLTYTVAQNGPTWDVSRLSLPQAGAGSTLIKANGIIDQYQANLILWNIKERNAATMAATQSKLDAEAREQNAILQALGPFTP
jgi:hypothetical protein